MGWIKRGCRIGQKSGCPIRQVPREYFDRVVAPYAFPALPGGETARAKESGMRGLAPKMAAIASKGGEKDRGKDRGKDGGKDGGKDAGKDGGKDGGKDVCTWERYQAGGGKGFECDPAPGGAGGKNCRCNRCG